MTLTEFLLARIAEDKERAAEWTYTENVGAGRERTVTVPVGVMSARVLAECAVKRSVLDLLIADSGDSHNAVRRGWAVEILHQYAAIYADHPDFDPEWRV